MDDLDSLIHAGEIENGANDGIHIEVIRDPAMKELFLSEHGLTQMPGYEVHHIIPLSEGGADSPENMVLIRSDLHHEITKAHSEYYGWHDK